MERTLQEIKEYFNNAQNHLMNLENGLHVLDEKVLCQQLRIATQNMGDAMESIEAIIREKDNTIQDMADDIHRVNLRSMQLIKDVTESNKAVIRVKELEKQVENLTDIILRSLKDIPVKGGEEDGS